MGRVLEIKCNYTLIQAMLTKQAIEMWRKHKMEITRGFTITMAMALAGKYTGKKYKRTEMEQAEKDLKEWIDKEKAPLF